MLVDYSLKAEYEDGRHEVRVEHIANIENLGQP